MHITTLHHLRYPEDFGVVFFMHIFLHIDKLNANNNLSSIGLWYGMVW